MKHVFTFLALFASFLEVHAQNAAVVLHEDWLNSTWTPTFRSGYTYDSNDSVVEVFNEEYDNSGWRNSSQIENTYNTNGDLEVSLTRHWDQAEGEWFDYYRSTRTYNGDNVLISSLNEVQENNDWNVETFIIYTYNAGNLINELRKVEDENGELVNFKQLEYTWNGDGNNTELLISRWDENAAEWVFDMRRERIYTSSGQISDEQIWIFENGEWNESRHNTYSYDAQDILIDMYSHYWAVDEQEWTENLQFTYSYNQDGSRYQQLTKQFDENLGFWINDYRITYAYEDELGVAEVLGEAKIFPNPASNQVTITLETEATGDISITDVTGKKVKDDSFSGVMHIISLDELAAGAYQLTISANGQATTRSIIKK